MESIVPPSALSRTPEMDAAYQDHLRWKRRIGSTACDMCFAAASQQRSVEVEGLSEEVQNILEHDISLRQNRFPYRLYEWMPVEEHHLLIPRQHIDDITSVPDLRDKFHAVLDELQPHYNTDNRRNPHSPTISIPEHLHVHFFRYRTDVRLSKINYDIKTGQADVEFEPKPPRVQYSPSS